MSRRHLIAVAVAITTMLVALVPPLWIQTTGDELVLEIAPVDPLSLFRGNYVDLQYDLDLDAVTEVVDGRFDTPVYVVFDNARPANVLRIEESRPTLGPSERCLRGRMNGSSRVTFPALEQFFVTPEQGQVLEQQLSSMVAIIKTTGSCRAILQDLELDS